MTSTATTTDAITIRPAREDDTDALRLLAQLDASRLPVGDVLIAEVDGAPRAAMRILDRTYVADPFYPTRELISLLDVRARRLSGERHGAARAHTRARGNVERALAARLRHPSRSVAARRPGPVDHAPVRVPAVRSARSAVR